ncbi:MAG: DegV family protein [Anaerolineae bacterium]|nr:DegV family protein [Anaerolineae bacterium]MBT7073716.1 DegV family protein [Anaerolineae bacterium]MBT7782149.1 DegV family protein [Anaerolineae bacterium]
MKIVTDCAADLSAKERDELGIVEAPLYIQFPEGEVNATDISPDDFYNRLEAMRPEIPTTAQPSSGLFAELYGKIAETKEQILSIHISSGLSGTLNSAVNGAAQLKEKLVSTIDSMTLSGGQRFQVLAAAKAAQAGWSLSAIEERLDAIREKTEVIYTLETLEYLARGGRIGRVQALAGSVLKIKPIIHVDHADGKYTTVGKGRTIKKNVATMVNHISDLYGDAPLWATVLHGRFEKGAEMMSDSLKNGLNIKKLEQIRISPVLGVHTGPGIVGAALVPMELVEDLF